MLLVILKKTNCLNLGPIGNNVCKLNVYILVNFSDISDISLK